MNCCTNGSFTHDRSKIFAKTCATVLIPLFELFKGDNDFFSQNWKLVDWVETSDVLGMTKWRSSLSVLFEPIPLSSRGQCK
jgi:hypothetical protein